MISNLKELIKILSQKEGLEWLNNDATLYFAVFGLVGSICAGSWKLLKFFINLRNERLLNADLSPFYNDVEVRDALQYYVETKGQNVAPSIANEPGQNQSFITKEKLIKHFIKQAFGRKNYGHKYHFVLADAGMGKTTFLINLYLRYRNKFTWFGLVSKYDIKLYPLANKTTLSQIEKTPQNIASNTILLLDALDEDYDAVLDYKKRLSEIMAIAGNFRTVIITCRTYFFPSEQEEPNKTGLMKYGGEKGEHEFGKIYLSPFDEYDIKKFLHKRYSIFQSKTREQAFKIVEQSPNLMVRPMLLNYIDYLVNDIETYDYTHQIYGKLIEKWIEREAKRQSTEVDMKSELYKFSREVALDIYNKRVERGGLFINLDELESFAKKHGIKIPSLELKSRSLLNRNVSAQYKFAHKSILEYFLAKEAIENKSFLHILNFEGMEVCKLFYQEFRKTRIIIPFIKSIKNNGIVICNCIINQKLIYITDTYMWKSIDIDFISLIEVQKRDPILKLSFIEHTQSFKNFLSAFPNLQELNLNLTEKLIEEITTFKANTVEEFIFDLFNKSKNIPESLLKNFPVTRSRKEFDGHTFSEIENFINRYASFFEQKNLIIEDLNIDFLNRKFVSGDVAIREIRELLNYHYKLWNNNLL